MSKKLKLYKVKFKPLWPIGGGFAFILAYTKREAKDAWLDHYNTPADAEDRLEGIEKVSNAEFYNGAVLVNENGDY